MLDDHSKSFQRQIPRSVRSHSFQHGLYAIVQALKTMPNVTKLNLRGNTCRNEGIEALGEFLKTNKSVQTLNLNENNLGSPGAVHIAEALKVHARPCHTPSALCACNRA